MSYDHARYYYLKEGALTKTLSKDVPLEENLVVYSGLSHNFFIYHTQWDRISEDHPKSVELKAYLLIEGILNA